MSFSFSIQAPEPPIVGEVFDGIDYWDIQCDKELSFDDPWPEGTQMLFRDGISARGIEITYENDEIQVRILTLSSPSDYELAFCFLDSIASCLDQEFINPEGEEEPYSFSIDQLRERYNQEWIQETNSYGLNFIKKMLDEEHQYVNLIGYRRDFYIGKRLYQELLDDGPYEELQERVIAKMIEVQSVDNESYFPAQILLLKKDREGDSENSSQEEESNPEKMISFSVVAPGIGYLIAKVKYIALYQENQSPLFIRLEDFRKLIPISSWSYVDECQFILEPIDEMDWHSFLETVEPFIVDPIADSE